MKKIISEKYAWVALRLTLGWIFLWAFIDKLFGLGFATAPERAWLAGGSPTAGFLANSPRGPFADIFNSLAGVNVIDWVFMGVLLFTGLALILNRYVKWGALAGGSLMALMYLALLPPENNPIVDEHIVYIAALALLATKKSKA